MTWGAPPSREQTCTRTSPTTKKNYASPIEYSFGKWNWTWGQFSLHIKEGCCENSENISIPELNIQKLID